MRTIVGVLIVAALAIGSGCVKTDWIDRTLVTVDVTGSWAGGETGPGTSYMIGSVRLELDQQGPTVKGTFKTAIQGTRGGPVEGTVTGDVLRFKQTNGNVEGELTVSGDEMTGYMDVPVAGRRPVSLHRLDPSSNPGSPPR
jgi:hypothetical protein